MDATVERASRAGASAARLRAVAELSKPRILLLVVLVAAASFIVASRAGLDWVRLAAAAAGTTLLGAGIFALNQFQERRADSLMRRTAARPLPSGKVAPLVALVVGAVTTFAACAYFLLLFGVAAASVAVSTFVSYVLVYTPLKTRTALHTTLGAISGAMPPLLGWAAARGGLAPGAWALFALLFFWQFPHFLAIDTIYSDDYARAGIKLLPAVDARGGRATAGLINVTLVLLVGASVLPRVLGFAGDVYLGTASLLGAAFLTTGILLARRRTKKSARLLLRASVLYLPVLFAVMALDPRV